MIQPIEVSDAIYVIAHKLYKNCYIGETSPSFLIKLDTGTPEHVYSIFGALSFYKLDQAKAFFEKYPCLFNDYRILEVHIETKEVW